MRSIEITVFGEPAPQGSKKHVGHGIMIESSKKVAPWRESVVWAAREAIRRDGMIPGPVEVTIEFYLRRPKSAPKKVTMPFRKPDIDKLVRSTFDSLVTAGVIEDDARVVSLAARKHFCTDDESLYGLEIPGARILVRSL